jgi:iron complex outermembrane receptor protein
MIFRQGVVPLLFNAGEAQIDGIEAEFYARPASWLILEGGLSSLDDEIQSITQIPGTVATIGPGDDLPMTPSLQANLGISVPIDLDERFTLTPRVDGTYTSSLVFITSSVPLIEQDEYAVGNATLTLADSKHEWRLTAGVLNLFDERYLIQGNASLATLGYAESIYARPRNWFLQLSIDF